MISKQFEVGLYSTYGDYISTATYESSSTFDESKSVNHSYGIGPYLRFYQPVIDKFYLFGNLEGLIQSNVGDTKNKNFDKNTEQVNSNSSKLDYSAISSYFKPGFIYMPINWFSIEMTVGSIGWSQSQASNHMDFDFNLNLKNLSLGSRFYF
jgi:hypothetical protein